MKSFYNTVLLLLFIFPMQSCTLTKYATLLDIETAEKITAKFTDSNQTGGSVEVVMPDGEVLSGTYTGIRGVDIVSFSNSTGFQNTTGSVVSNNGLNATGTVSSNYSEAGSTRTVGGQGKAYALLSSTKSGSRLVMEIIAIYNVVGGGGFGDARTNDGRVYRVIL